MRSSPFIALSALAVLGASAHALTLTTPYDLKDAEYGTTPQGHHITRLAPEIVDSGSDAALWLQSRLATSYPQRIPLGTRILAGGPIQGEARVRSFAVSGLSFASDYLGAEIVVDLVQPVNDPALRWIKVASYAKTDAAPNYGISIIGMFGEEAIRPYYYTEQADQGWRLPEGYRIQGGNWNIGDPGDYVWDNWYFPVSVTQNGAGVANSIVVHDGVHLSALTHVAKPVPEPTTMAALGLGLCSLLRRKNRRR